MFDRSSGLDRLLAKYADTARDSGGWASTDLLWVGRYAVNQKFPVKGLTQEDINTSCRRLATMGYDFEENEMRIRPHL